MINKSMYYIYAYIDPRNNLPFYIGKGKDTRKFDHLNENSSKKENKDKWQIIKELTSLGITPIIQELESNIQNEELAYNREDYYILTYGRKGIEPHGILTNKTIGGKHPPKPNWSTEKRKQHSEWNKTYWTDERKKIHREKHLSPVTTQGLEIIKLCSIGTISVTDSDGNSRRIPKSEYDNTDKSIDITKWKYVPVASKESKRRRLCKEHP
jgi:hypothetical protein